jgi:hypothetical protein
MSAHINDSKTPKKIIESKKIHVILKKGHATITN